MVSNLWKESSLNFQLRITAFLALSPATYIVCKPPAKLESYFDLLSVFLYNYQGSDSPNSPSIWHK
jgi:hypothetical protein